MVHPEEMEACNLASDRRADKAKLDFAQELSFSTE
jgi:hypothetical protein